MDIPTLTLEEKKTATRMMAILHKKLEGRGIHAYFGNVGAILSRTAKTKDKDPQNSIQIILNTKAVKEAMNILRNGSQTREFLSEKQLQVLENLFHKEDDSYVGLNTLFNLLEKIQIPPTEYKKRGWKEILIQAAQETNLAFTPEEMSKLCALPLFQKVFQKTFRISWATKEVMEIISNGEPWEGGILQEELAQWIASVIQEALQEMDPATREPLLTGDREILKSLGTSLWEDILKNILNLARIHKAGGIQIAQIIHNSDILYTLTPKLETQKNPQAFEHLADQLHQAEFKGTAEDPVPISPFGWAILLAEILDGNPLQLPTKKQLTLLPHKPELGEETKILTHGEIMGSKDNRALHVTGVWNREHILSLIKDETDFPLQIDPENMEYHLFNSHDHLPLEERAKASSQFLKETFEGQPQQLEENLLREIAFPAKGELVPWENIRVLRSEPENEEERRLDDILKLSASADHIWEAAKQECAANASLAEISQKEAEIRLKIAQTWTTEWILELTRNYQVPPNFPESVSEWIDSWTYDIYRMNVHMACGTELFKMMQQTKPGTRPTGFTGTILKKLTEWETPLYWIKKDFFRAAMETDLPPNLKFTDFQWPIPAGAFFLEEGSLEVDGSPVGSITFAKVDKNTPASNQGITFVPTPQPKKPLHNLLASANILIGQSQMWLANTMVSLDNTIEAACQQNEQIVHHEELLREHIRDNNPLNWEEEEIPTLNIPGKELAEKLPRILAKLNLALSCRPSLIQKNHDPPTRDREKPQARQGPERNLVSQYHRSRIQDATIPLRTFGH